uniref:Uncharacterized protein n=2 Tax=Cyclophora tenuis TaxID=216820 RepID=A0A7S1GIN0_CYCTE
MTKDVNDESAGWDNIKISAHINCSTPMTGTNHPPSCVPSLQIHSEDFEDEDLTGWTNGVIEGSTGFTTFLGRYGKSNSGPGKDPFKTFGGIPRHATSVTFQFHFYEIDGWDMPDQAVLVVNDKSLDLGNFEEHLDENNRSATAHGMKFQLVSEGPPAHIGFNSEMKDQKHLITVTIPSSFYEIGGELNVMFQVRTTADNIDSESAGWDDIKITAHFNCPSLAPTTSSPTNCLPSRELYNEDFEDNGLTGWTNGVLQYSTEFTTFLGRYGNNNSGPGKDPYKTYRIPSDATSIILEFNFYELDSWDGRYEADQAILVVNNKSLSLGRFDMYDNENGRNGSAHYMTFELSSEADPFNIGFGSFFDQKHLVKVTIPSNFYEETGEITIMFQTRLSESMLDDESAGWDNIKITASFRC